MTASTASVFPPSVDELVPRARARAVELGAPLSRNRTMREFGALATKELAELHALGLALDMLRRQPSHATPR
jgi:hypothetical protein